MFETFEKRSYESANGGRILKGKNNFGGSGLADVKVNSGAYLKATTTQTKYTVTSPSTSTSLINATLEVSLENKGHSVQIKHSIKLFYLKEYNSYQLKMLEQIIIHRTDY